MIHYPDKSVRSQSYLRTQRLNLTAKPIKCIQDARSHATVVSIPEFPLHEMIHKVLHTSDA